MQIEIQQLERKYASLRISDPARRRRLAASLFSEGQLIPVMVVRSQSESRYVLIDGYARVQVLGELSRDCVEAVVLDQSEPEALMWSYGLCSGRRSSMLEEAWLVSELVEAHRKSFLEVAMALQRSVSWVSRRLALIEVLPESVQAAVKEGVLAPQAAMKYLVPLARANTEHCERLVASLGKAGVSVREMHRLYVGWRRGDSATRDRIVSQPQLYLKVEEEMSQPEEVDSPMAAGEALTGDLETLASVCRRARRRLRAGTFARASACERETAISAWRQSELAFGVLARYMTEEISHAGSGRTHSHSTAESSGSRDSGHCSGVARVAGRRAQGVAQQERRGLHPTT